MNPGHDAPTSGPPRVLASHARRGFTLVEIIVVVAIIALLMALLLPTLSRARESARIVACQTRIRAQLQAHQVYGGNYSDQKPPILYLLAPGAYPGWAAFYTPNTAFMTKPVGQGLLVAGGYLPFDALLCTSGDMVSDTLNDKLNWQQATTYLAGSSYVYYWRDPDQIKSVIDWTTPITYQQMRLSRHMAMIMDSNFEAGSDFLIAGTDSGTPWTNHPRHRITNIGYLDGAVLSVPAAQAMLRAPCTDTQAIQWWADAEAAR